MREPDRVAKDLDEYDSGIGLARWESGVRPSEALHGTHQSRADGMAGNHSPPTLRGWASEVAAGLFSASHHRDHLIEATRNA